MGANPKPNTSGKLRVRRPLQPRPPEQKIKRFLAEGKKVQWGKGRSGNPSGRKKGTYDPKSYKAFVEACRELSPKALDRLREALELPFSKQTARTVLTASALVLERAYGRSVQIQIDASPPQTAPAIALNDEYWADMTAALRESGALKKPLEAPDEKDVVDAEVVEVKQIEPPK